MSEVRDESSPGSTGRGWSSGSHRAGGGQAPDQPYEGPETQPYQPIEGPRVAGPEPSGYGPSGYGPDPNEYGPAGYEPTASGYDHAAPAYDPAAPDGVEPPGRRWPPSRQTLIVVLVALLVLIAALFGAKSVLDRRARNRTAVVEATASVRDAINARYAAMGGAATQGADAAGALRITLQEHLTVSQRTDQQLTADRQRAQTTLTATGQQLQNLAAAPPPAVPELANMRQLRPQLERLADMQRRAGELGGRYLALSAASERWATTLGQLRSQAARYVSTVEAQPEIHDPAGLRGLWEKERDVLREYRAAADAAKRIPGLAPLADAYLAYIDANLRFADEAIKLLNDGQIDPYNQRLRQTFGVPDPFGFQASIARATTSSIDSGVIADLGTVNNDARDLVAQMEGARRDLGS